MLSVLSEVTADMNRVSCVCMTLKETVCKSQETNLVGNQSAPNDSLPCFPLVTDRALLT